MDIWHIKRCLRLEGEYPVQGSKNASLPILAASIVCPAVTELEGVPCLDDVDAALRILRHLGCETRQDGHSVYIDSRTVSLSHIPNDLMAEMRSSVIFMGALLARCGEAKLSPPGGCQLGKRPIDLHLYALRRLGAEIEEENGEISCRAEGLRGAEITLPFPSVGATENAVLAACAAAGETVIHGAAREPEIVALQDYLRAAGVDIYGAGSDRIVISRGRPRTHIHMNIISDRIVASTVACAAAAVGGDVTLKNIDPSQISTVMHFLNEAGCDIIKKSGEVRIISDGRLRAVGPVSTAPYPGFPTDAQPVLMAALLKADGVTRIYENIFENRFRQVEELCRLGADIRTDGMTAEIHGVPELHGAQLKATDLRGGAAMLIAALSAEWESAVLDSGHITRGYENFDSCLRTLGASIYMETKTLT